MGRCKHHEVCELESPQIPDDGLCILHSNDPDKSGGGFQIALKNQLQRSHDFRFIVFPVSLGGHDLFQNNAWGHFVHFDHATFLEAVSFVEFAFTDGVTFEGAVFHAKADFHGARFPSGANFSRTRFEEDADFGGCTFGDKERPNHDIRFDSAVFKKEAKFSGWNEKTGKSVPSKFLGRAFFPNAVFVGTADFSNVDFAAQVEFVQTAFHGEASFRRAIFRELSAFVGSTTERVFLDVAKFEAVTVSESGFLRFDGVRLEQAFFHDADVKNIEFIGVKWAVVGLKRIAFKKWANTSLPSRWVERLLPGRQAVYDEIASQTEGPPWARLERLYNHLRKNYEERRDFGTAGDFHAGEKEMRLRNPETPVATRVALAAYKLACQFGETWPRPLGLFLLLLLFVSSMQVLAGLNAGGEVPSGGSLPSFWSRLGPAILSTVETSLRLGTTDVGASPLSRVCRLIMVIFGPVLLGLFALAVRQRVRR